jgi:glutamate 5-kinase
MNKMDYRQRIKDYKRIVIKIGTTSLTNENGKLNLRRIDKLAWVVSDLRNKGIDVLIVSSGAIAVGADKLGLAERPRDIIGKQASSAVGQAVLMQIYERSFGEYNQKPAQILITKDAFANALKKRNARNTIDRLFELNVIPIVNENDTIATEELNEFSDNDTLSAYVADLIDSDALIILSDIEGLYTCDPNKNKNAEIISTVTEIGEDIYKIAGGSASSLGTGGMATKVQAAELLNSRGIDMLIAHGEDPTVIFDLLDGKKVGTMFVAPM